MNSWKKRSGNQHEGKSKSLSSFKVYMAIINKAQNRKNIWPAKLFFLAGEPKVK
jgi:hypothetical protein